MNNSESCLEELKKNYEIYKNKYNLPEFSKLNQDFGIERIAEIETDLLLREIRKFIADRISNYLRFIESLLNPSNASIFIFSVCKTLDTGDKKEIEELYKELMKIELDLIEIDVEYIEEKEASFINDSYKKWSLFKVRWKKLIDAVKKNWDNKVDSNNKGYFG